MNPEISEVNEHYFCLILAGGRGRRLWPVSRESRPKQFLDLFGTGQTLLQQTYARMAAFLPKRNILVSTYCEYADMVREQLPDLAPDRLLCEPVRRNTAPIVAWAGHRIETIDLTAALVVTPSDQMVTDERRFERDILDGLAHATSHGCFLTMGIRPTRPEPGYGYIQLGESDGETDFYRVRSFTEKPERDFARMFMESGEFLWNTGLFVSTAATLRERLSGLLPSVMRSFDAAAADSNSASELWQRETEWVERHYATYPNISLESGILERTAGVCVKQCHFGWADIGTWHSIYEVFSAAQGDNVALDTNTQLSETTGCVVALPKGRIAVINGLKDFIVAEHGDVLLITPRSDSSDEVVRQLTRYGLSSAN